MYLLTSANQVPTLPIAKVVEDFVSVVLRHFGVDVETGVAQLGYLLGQQLHSLSRVAEDDALVDLELCGLHMHACLCSVIPHTEQATLHCLNCELHCSFAPH